MSAPVAQDVGCVGCRHLHIFAARSDERERYGFGETGYGCNHPVDGGVYVLNPETRSCFQGRGFTRATGEAQ